MKKKQFLAAFVSLLLIFVMAGCSSSQNSNQANAASNNNGNSSNANVNGFGTPNVYGEVSSVNGNKVTLKLMKIPQFSARNGQRNGQGYRQGNGQGGGNWQNGQNSGNGSNGGYRGGGGFGGMRQRQYTGQTTTIVIPSGTSLVTITRGANGMSETNISMNQVTVGSTLSIYYKEDGKTIDKIRVMMPRTGRGNGQGNGASNGQGSGSTTSQGTNGGNL